MFKRRKGVFRRKFGFNKKRFHLRNGRGLRRNMLRRVKGSYVNVMCLGIRTTIENSAGVDAGFAITTRPADISNFGRFANAFQQYKINKIVTIFEPNNSQMIQTYQTASTGTDREYSTTSPKPTLTTTIDYDDDTPPTSALHVEGAHSAKKCWAGDKHVRVWIPTIPIVTDGASGATIAPKRSNKYWLRTLDTETVFFGLKAFIDCLGTVTATKASWTVHHKIYMSFRYQNSQQAG